MPVFTQSTMSIAGNVVDITADAEPVGLLYLQPGAFVEIPETWLPVRKGEFTVSVGSLDKDNPSTVEHGRTYFNGLPITIDVYKAGNTTPVASTTTTAEKVPAPTPDRPRSGYRTHLKVNAGSVDESAPYSRTLWRVRLTNNTTRVAQVGWTIRHIRDSSLITESAIPISLLNTTFGMVLNALAPKATVHGRTLKLELSPEIAEYIGALPADGVIERDLSDRLPVDAHGELSSVNVALVSGADVLRAVDDEWTRRDRVISASGSVGALATAQVTANNKWREGWHDAVDATDVAVELSVVLTDIDLVLGKLWTETISAGQIADASAKIFLTFKSHTAFTADRFGKGHVLVVTPAHYEGVIATIADALGKAPEIGPLIEKQVAADFPKVHLYFAEALIRMVHDQYAKRFIDCRIVGEHLHVRFCDDPRDPDAFPRAVETPPSGTPPSDAGGGRGHRGIDGTVGTTTIPPVAERGPEIHEPIGVVPADFLLGSDESVVRLDNINTIVVVMMENRSFDHLLGRLSRKWPDKGYICYPDDASNTVPGHSPVKMRAARDAEHERAYYALAIDPYHGTKHVLAQINGGRMDGFARDILTKPDLADRNPQIPMTYYDETDLPFYYYLAEQYMVCDQWFAAHPGGTYPNRWAFLSGQMPLTGNFPPDDRRMGFIKTPTIFDYLHNAGVDWVYYEANLGMLRMYNNYRLDTKRVLPFYDKEVGFAARAKAGTLPPVVFIEPKITGIPPLAQASDDHPPANLLRGQEFLGGTEEVHGHDGVYTALRRSPQWSRSMLVITYDEHGGFYDHVPPPGTPLGDPAWRLGGFPKIHPQGETFLGPRVPTFLVSPLVEPGSVSHQIFDHTSVLKTILVRHRARFERNLFGMFGARVPMISHLGEALNRSTPRTEPMGAPAHKPRTTEGYGDVAMPRPTLASLPPDVLQDNDELSYGFSLARAMMPKR